MDERHRTWYEAKKKIMNDFIEVITRKVGKCYRVNHIVFPTLSQFAGYFLLGLRYIFDRTSNGNRSFHIKSIQFADAMIEKIVRQRRVQRPVRGYRIIVRRHISSSHTLTNANTTKQKTKPKVKKKQASKPKRNET